MLLHVYVRCQPTQRFADTMLAVDSDLESTHTTGSDRKIARSQIAAFGGQRVAKLQPTAVNYGSRGAHGIELRIDPAPSVSVQRSIYSSE
jgi:hypothetical protein